ncbi:MAG: transposase [bacterium]|nr:transposase [bacterium]
MAKVTQHFGRSLKPMKSHNTMIFLLLWCMGCVLYAPEILNANIEQEVQSMTRKYTLQEMEFLEYFRSIDKHTIGEILSEYHSTGPTGYSSSLVLSRILKVKERISSDRELTEKLAKNPIYRDAVGINSNEIPAHNTFNTLRHRLGTEGFLRIHRHFVFQAYKTGLLTPPLKNLPEMLGDKIILIGDSTFLLAVASTKGEKDKEGNWLFTDESIAFGRPHHKHKYPVGHRAHTVMSVSGIPIVSLLAPANESDETYIMPVLWEAVTRYPEFPFGCVILDSGYDSEDLHRDIYTEFHLLPIIIRKPSMKYGRGFSTEGTPLCPFGYPTRRKGIEYNHQRTKFACYHICKKDSQRLIFKCPYEDSKSRFGWMTRTRFKDSYRKQGPAVPGSRAYKRLKPLRTGIERYYGLAKENRYRMESSNTYMGHDNVLIHVIEHDIVLTLDIIFQHARTGKRSDVIEV